MRNGEAKSFSKSVLLAPALFLCLAPAALSAKESASKVSIISNGDIGLSLEITEAATNESQPFPLLLDNNGGLDFDLGGSDTQKLELQLSQPLSLQGGMRSRALDSGNMLGLDATLNMPVSDNFNLTAGIDRQRSSARFHSLGSIQCMNGVLRADSYTASGCRFIDEPIATADQQRIDLGASWDFDNATASFNWFNQDANIGQSDVRQLSPTLSPVMGGGNLLSPNLGNPLLATPGSDPLQFLNGEASGVDLNFKVGISTSNSGDIQLGLAFSHVLEAEYQGVYAGSSEALSWTVAEPFNSASMNLEWSRGTFSGGVQGFYRDSVDFLNRNSVDSLTTFDVHFTWRTPWNANLSVGASNVMNAGAETSTSADKQPVDPLESVYGRIPYVRYKQDL